MSQEFEYEDCVAIVGMSCRFPGANSVNEFWSNLINGVESIRTLTDEEIDLAGGDGSQLKSNNYVNRCSHVDSYDMFDASFFDMTDREARLTDPAQRFLFLCAYEALEDAGYARSRAEHNIGCFLGVNSSSYLLNVMADVSPSGRFEGLGPTMQVMIGNDRDYTCTRISHKLNLQGPSLTISTACSTSLVAISTAFRSLINFECDMALAGASKITPYKAGYIYEEGGVKSKNGSCRAFDEDATGTVFGSGAGIVLLKRFNEAIEDGDNIYALIRSVSVNNDGSSKIAFSAPSIDGQKAVIQNALAFADVDVDTIRYVEAHGTGTPLGDPIEISALRSAFEELGAKNIKCALGSVKTNIGHLEAASGVAGLIKVACSLKNRLIPPSLNFENPNPAIPFGKNQFYVNDKLRAWDDEGCPRRAGISSFGIGGTNAHSILEEAPIISGCSFKKARIISLSAKSEPALIAFKSKLKNHLLSHPKTNIADLAFSLHMGREEFKYRFAFLAQNNEDLITALENSDGDSSLRPSFEGSNDTPILFMFPGQGAQFANMGRDLYVQEPVFKAVIDQCSEIIKRHHGYDIRSLLGFSGFDSSVSPHKINETEFTQPALFIICFGLAKLWESCGIKPSCMIGHSLGEYVAACVAGVFSLEDALNLVAIRAKLMQAAPNGSMLAVMADVDTAKVFCQNTVDIAAYNSSTNLVLSGSNAAIDSIAEKMGESGLVCKKLNTSHAFHSRMMAHAGVEFLNAFREIKLSAPSIPFISCLTGTWIQDSQAKNPEYWLSQMMSPVQFQSGVKKVIEDHSKNIISIEVGPGKTLTQFIKNVTSKSCLYNISLIENPDAAVTTNKFYESLANLWGAGVDINWNSIYEGERRIRISLPTYPFQLKKYWTKVTPKLQANKVDGPMIPTLERLNIPFGDGIYYQIKIDKLIPEYLTHHQVGGNIIVPAASYLEYIQIIIKDIFKSAECCFSEVVFASALLINQVDKNLISFSLSAKSDNKYFFQVLSRSDADESQEQWNLHCSGYVQYGNADNNSSMLWPKVDTDYLKNHSDVSALEFYSNLQKNGFSYGRLFQWVSEIYAYGGNALVKLELPNEYRENILLNEDKFIIHPGLIDSCLQCTSVALKTLSDINAKKGTYLPFSIANIYFNELERVQDELWCSVKLIEDKENSLSSSIKADIQLRNTKGVLIAGMSGYSARFFNAEAMEKNKPGNGKNFYETYWKPAQSLINIADNNKKQEVLIFSNGNHIADITAKKLSENGGSVISATFDENAAFTSDSNLVGFDRRDIQRLLNRSFQDVNNEWLILFFVKDSNIDDLNLDDPHFDKVRNQTFNGILSLVQAVDDLNPAKFPRLMVVTNGSRQVSSDVPITGLMQSLVWGMSQVINLEYPQFKCKLLDIPSVTTECSPEIKEVQSNILISEILTSDNNKQVAYMEEKRFVARLREWPVNHNEINDSLSRNKKLFRIDENGTYLIVGGLGGLGLLCAEWLVSQGAKHIVLLGRNINNEKVSNRLKAIEGNIRKLLVLSCDIANAESVNRVMTQVKGAMPELKGCIHAAGVINDALIPFQSEESFEAVLEAKVNGTWNLHQSFGSQELDFFIIFSSAVSVLGNYGQINYAAANAFQDTLASYRNSMGLPTTSINWSGWTDVGMTVDLIKKGESQEHMITREKGFEYLDKILKSNTCNNNILVLPSGGLSLLLKHDSYKNNDFFEDLLSKEALSSIASITKKPLKPEWDLSFLASQEEESIVLGVINVINQLMQDQFGITSVNSMDCFNDLGVDSLMAMQLRNQLQNLFAIEGISVVSILDGASIHKLSTNICAKILQCRSSLESQDFLEKEESVSVRI